MNAGSRADLLKTMVLARPPQRASTPRPGDKILVFKEPWLTLVLSGKKTLEVRAAPYKSGAYWFGTRGQQQQTERAQHAHTHMHMHMTHIRRDLRPGTSRTSGSR